MKTKLLPLILLAVVGTASADSESKRQTCSQFGKYAKPQPKPGKPEFL